MPHEGPCALLGPLQNGGLRPQRRAAQCHCRESLPAARFRRGIHPPSSSILSRKVASPAFVFECSWVYLPRGQKRPELNTTKCNQAESKDAARLATMASWHGIKTHNAIKALHLDDRFGSRAEQPGYAPHHFPVAVHECCLREQLLDQKDATRRTVWEPNSSGGSESLSLCIVQVRAEGASGSD